MPSADGTLPLLSRIDRTAEWMRGTGPLADIVLTCRVRLARNLAGCCFPPRCDDETLIAIAERAAAVHSCSRALAPFEFVRMQELTELERYALVDRYLCSREHVAQPVGRALVLDRSGSLSVMINEEDHFRIQALYSGLQLETAYRVCAGLEEVLESALGFAFSEKWGYLTACPTNVGTGLRASAMIHLPGLTETGRLDEVLTAAANAGLAVRGLYGEGTEAHGSLHQFSNQVTLGRSEEELVAELSSSCKQIAAAERDARAALHRKSPLLLDDHVARAYATLRYARSVTSREALDCLSWLRWGAEIDLARGLDRQTLNELIIWIRPGVQQVLHTRRLPAEERDVLRASLLRKRFEQVELSEKLSS
ncbi:MAG: ATP--guanido phosphotransferase [Armatimonadetes bacterium CG_4_10_14_3_um_filter_66_18]|nr:protein arginine kinase [Armatimonadota bacterium]OIO92256.1 MAG: protein arginine kinase [Armatimonadetes bacterium CG2_30_66_41]PIU93058.1 MAG: ATP--guanido phosphotransferase [Armatimonadetes bacterium CG06_land_8_20_14_3_00_66_21]PIX37925.1 MAG: ATP--guanido phosphotransferase [Armatimonadetes bacterium CG_4_8_14_3_um_filter_66_20]PIY49287.1 MAG: ATP--guanido phosphotransferase [Armatimonadetes bacterium CG_4_10_14_3_um_filter_66_18]PIZ37450.1 MAG: ATP--guanido phosphotransferase [Armat